MFGADVVMFGEVSATVDRRDWNGGNGERSGCTDRRGAQRYRLALPVELGDSRGRTPDISTSGVFLELATDRGFTPGESVSLTLRLEHVNAGYPVRLQCQGVVMRVEGRDGNVGLAVAFTALRFA